MIVYIARDATGGILGVFSSEQAAMDCLRAWRVNNDKIPGLLLKVAGFLQEWTVAASYEG